MSLQHNLYYLMYMAPTRVYCIDRGNEFEPLRRKADELYHNATTHNGYFWYITNVNGERIYTAPGRKA